MFSKVFCLWISKWSLSDCYPGPGPTQDVLDFVVGVLLLLVLLDELAHHLVLVAKSVFHLLHFPEVRLLLQSAVQVQHKRLKFSLISSNDLCLLVGNRPVFVGEMLPEFVVFVIPDVHVLGLEIV